MVHMYPETSHGLYRITCWDLEACQNPKTVRRQSPGSALPVVVPTCNTLGGVGFSNLIESRRLSGNVSRSVNVRRRPGWFGTPPLYAFRGRTWHSHPSSGFHESGSLDKAPPGGA